MSKKRHVLPVLVGMSTAALGGCDDKQKTDVGETSEPTEKKKKTRKRSTPKPKPTTIIRDPERIPQHLGGAAMPLPPPSATPPKSKAPKADAPSPEGAAPGAPGAAARAAEPADAEDARAIAIVHNHPADEPCQPLTEGEVKKALEDLRAQ